MTQAPITDPRFDTPDDNGSSEKNTLGLVGFVLSILQFVTCGALAIIPLIICLIALRKTPRVLAIVGTILSAIGLLFFALIGFGIISAVLFAGPAIQQISGGSQATFEIITFYNQNGALPTDAEAQAIFSGYDFGPGITPRYTIIDDTTAEILLPGADGQFDTADDMPFPIEVGP
ncbi:MAG: DUF4190 domain-containing protein [Planctomycetota bacterium]